LSLTPCGLWLKVRARAPEPPAAPVTGGRREAACQGQPPNIAKRLDPPNSLLKNIPTLSF
jgi:hypothetical protein